MQLPDGHQIDIKATEALGKSIQDITTNDKVIVRCICGKTTKLNYRRSRVVDYKCHSCKLKEKWQDPNYRNKMNKHLDNIRKNSYNEESINKISQISKEKWKDSEYRNKQLTTRSTEKFKKEQSERSKEIWNNIDRKNKLSKTISKLKNTKEEKNAQSNRSKKQWNDEEYKKKVLGKYYDESDEEKQQRRTNKHKRHRYSWSPRKYLGDRLIGIKRNRRCKDFDINIDYIMDLWSKNKGKCNLTGIKMYHKPKRLDTVSTDRIDPSKGYIKGNIQLICQFLNFAKSNLPNDSIIQVIDNIKNNNYHISDNSDKISLDDYINNSIKFIVNTNIYTDNRKFIDIDIDYIKQLYYKQGGKCALSNFTLLTSAKPNHYNLSIDRIDSSKGHIRDNIQLVCRFINLGKRDYTNAEVLTFLNKVKTSKTKAIPVNIVDFQFNELSINKTEYSQAASLIQEYHYKHKIGRAGTHYGITLNNNLIGVCIFAHPTYQAIIERLGCDNNEVQELSRFVIHPSYQKKNLASWFISRCVKLIKKEKPSLKYLISFADTTYGHIGIIYRASNWKLDGIVPPSYVYKNSNGKEIHKKTVWNKSKSEGIGELQMAEKLGLTKEWKSEKYRYLWKY